MKSQIEVESRLKGLLCQELDRRVAESTLRLPKMCQHNYRHPLDHRKTVDGIPNPDHNRIAKHGLPVAQTMGLCMLGSAEDPHSWRGDICEDPLDAQRCPHFQVKQTAREVYDSFLKDLETRQLSGEVVALLWVLNGQNVVLPWWKKVLFRFLRVSYEPLVTPIREVAAGLLPDIEDFHV